MASSKRKSDRPDPAMSPAMSEARRVSLVQRQADAEGTGPAKGSKRPEPAHRPHPETDLDPGLYLVATPIGNARDITLRALDILAAADAVLCEDTRVTGRLLTIHGIENSLIAYHEHNAARVRPKIMRRLAAGERIALVSDAGTPLISDPGYRFVEECQKEDIPITAAPGASAVLTALVLSGLPTDRFHFAGFLPPKSAARRTAMKELKDIKATLVFFESARRLPAFLEDLAHALGNREVVVARELTKRFEEVCRGDLPDVIARYREEGPPKGEVVVIVGGPGSDTAGETDPAIVDAMLRQAMEDQSPSRAAREVARDLKLPKRLVYERAMALAKEDEADEGK